MWDGAPRHIGEISQPAAPGRNLDARRGLEPQGKLRKGRQTMLGKIAGALIGERLAGKNNGARGAILGIVAETVVKRVIPTVAAAAILGFAYKKAKNALDGKEPSYPSDASPSPPSG